MNAHYPRIPLINVGRILDNVAAFLNNLTPFLRDHWSSLIPLINIGRIKDNLRAFAIDRGNSHHYVFNRAMFIYVLRQFYLQWWRTFLFLELVIFSVSYQSKVTFDLFRQTNIGRSSIKKIFIGFILLPVVTAELALLVYQSHRLPGGQFNNLGFLFMCTNYYFASHPQCENLCQFLLSFLRFRWWEDFGNLYPPLILSLKSILWSAGLAVGLLWNGHTFAVLSCFFWNIKPVYRRITSEMLIQSYIASRVVSKYFRYPTEQELRRNGIVCSICLEVMERAIATPCDHYFHTNCMKQCLLLYASNKCPICKRYFAYHLAG